MASAGAVGFEVDSSAPATSARLNAHLTIDPRSRIRRCRRQRNAARCIEEGRRFDAIVLDPPKFAPSAAHAERASRAYKDINRLALKLLVPGGLLFTFSCSGGIGAELFHKIVAGAGLDAGVDGLIVQRLGAAPDHPMTITFPRASPKGQMKAL
jgi:23S rRNA (cytosine1962-C5)-methyltransferase